ncbi:MAG TPA: glycosyl hydrolase [Flavilitoribacter sp.]|nr:glycosyl hydrolase [Flavilitoribacter sp.]
MKKHHLLHLFLLLGMLPVFATSQPVNSGLDFIPTEHVRTGERVKGSMHTLLSAEVSRKPAITLSPSLTLSHPPTPQSLTFDSTLFNGLQWRLVGPFRGGRSCTVTGVPGKPNLYYMGSAGGGAWRSKDGGNTWTCISDGFFGGSIGAVAVAPSDPNVIYVGEGEETIRGDVSSGWGLWRSTDAGTTWKYIGLRGSEHIGRIRVHPQNPDLVYVAAMGNLWKPNDVRGVYRSKDGGNTWERILYESDKAGAVDLVFDPNNPRILYASTWEVKRNGYRLDSGGPGTHLWKSLDSGDTWTKLTANEGLPKGTLGIIGVAVSPVNSDRVWAIIEAKDGGVFRSDNAGKTWTKTSSFNELRQRAWYYSRIYADTQDEDRLYVCNVGFWRSKDGGKTYESISTPHGDHHDLWIDPADNQRMIIADDGGAQVSYDAGENWTTYHNQPTAQFYRVTTDNHFPYRILGAQQDNSTVRILHRSQDNRITERDWEPSAGGESAHLAPDPLNPDIVYAGTYKGYMSRVDHTTGQERSTNVWPDNPAGSGAEVMKYRFNWNFPVFFSPNDPKKLYAASNFLHVTTNEGQSWEVISPDLTRNDPETIKSSGGAITQDNTGVEYYATIFAVAESPYEDGVIWAGSDDGLLHITRDGGRTWTDVTPPKSPKWNMMNCIDVHPTIKGGAYLAATSYKFGGYTPYLYKTTDYGKTWKLITNGINPNHYARAIRADPVTPGLLYAGTEWGMYVSFDDGENWQRLQLNLPIVSIRDLHIRDNALIAATHGRSFWMIDDLTPLRELRKEVAAREFYLYHSKPAIRMEQGGGFRSGSSLLEGENHPNGVLFHYFVNNFSDSAKVKLEILEPDGDVIQTYSTNTKERRQKLDVKKGGNRFVWDMRYPGFTEFPGMVLYSSPNRGPKAPPGKYKARLTVNGESMEQEFEIVKDPRLPNTPEDYQRQFDFLIKVRDKVSEAHQAILDIRAVRKDLDYIKGKLGPEEQYAEVKKLMAGLDKDMGVIENNIHQTNNQSVQDAINYGIRLNNRLAFLMADQQRGDFPPTDQALEVREQISVAVDKEIDDLEKVWVEELGKLNDMIKALGISPIKAPVRKERKP